MKHFSPQMLLDKRYNLVHLITSTLSECFVNLLVLGDTV